MTHPLRLFPLFFLGIAFAQAPPRSAFDVASIKPSAPLGGPNGIAGAAPPGFKDHLDDLMLAARGAGIIPMVDESRVSLRRRTLSSLIAAAWSLPVDQVTGPAWMSEQRFDVDATLPPAAPRANVNAMMQSLLEDRFALRCHRETKEVSGYALALAKSGAKLTPASPGESLDEDARKKKATIDAKNLMANTKSAAEDGVSHGGSTARWSNPAATMAELAAHLSRTLHKPVVDATALGGAYSIELLIQIAPDDDPASAASQALSRYGLRLDPRKLPAELLVVDSVSRNLKEN